MFRPRFFIYAVLILAMGALFVARAANRESFQVSVLRSQGMPYTIEDGVIRNLYTLHLQNKSDAERVYFLAPATDALAGHTGVEYIIPQDRVQLERLGDRQLTLFAMMPRSSYTVAQDFHFAVTDSVSGTVENVKVRFRGP